MSTLREVINGEITKKILFILLLIIMFVMTKSMFGVFILTFLFIYIIDTTVDYIIKKLPSRMNIARKYIAILVYILIFSVITGVFYKYFPVAVSEGKDIVEKVSQGNISVVLNNITYYSGIDVNKFIKAEDIEEIKNGVIGKSFHFVKEAGIWGINILISIILSIFFLMEKEKIIRFLKRFEKSDVSGLYKYFDVFWKSFIDSFGKIMKAQVIIAFVNTILSVIGLWILGFPGLIALGFMVMIFSLVPVAGVIVSMIPLTFIAFTIGGFSKVIALFVMIALIHAIETYILNPKIMSDKTDMPVFITFLVLIISEHFMGVWGLLIGLPFFIFLINMANIDTKEKIKKEEVKR